MNYQERIKKLRKSKIYLDDYQTQEIIKCRNDIIYFVENYGVILHPKLGLTKIKLYPKQKEVLENLVSYPFNIILKCRQIGISTTIALFGAWTLTLIPSFYLGIVSRSNDEAVELGERIKRIIKNLPAFLWGGDFIVNNKKSFELMNGSKCVISAPIPDALRGETLNYVIMDEVASMRHVKQIFASAYFTVSQNFANLDELYSKKMREKPMGIALISTAGNLKDFWVKWFYKRWISAVNQNIDYSCGNIKWKAISIHWSEVPFCDSNWYESIKRNYGEDMELFEQEMELKFIGEEDVMKEESTYIARDFSKISNEIFSIPEFNWKDIKDNYNF